MRTFVTGLIFTIIATAAFAATGEDSTSVTRESGPELTLVLGNGSNPVDGVFGPLTYGLAGSYEFANGWGAEALFVRLHEPGEPTFSSHLDEGRLSLHLPAVGETPGGLTLAATLWSNRTVDMYTNVAGIEATKPVSTFTLTGGLYYGSATRDEIAARFEGAQFGVATRIGILELELSHLAGVIHMPDDPSALGKGTYHRSAFEVAADLKPSLRLPVTATFDVERRFFNFGMGGPRIDPPETYIYVLGVEIILLGR